MRVNQHPYVRVLLGPGETLWDSLAHGNDEASVEQAWEAELARRSKEIDEGRAEFVSWEEVKAQIAKRLGEK
jgi:putative addiction module component (TIGR02574 family)